VCEILDPHTQKTIVGNKHLSLLSDFCQTNRLTAQVMAMVAEERAVKCLLDELLGSVGCSIAVVPSSRYANPDERISFYAISQRANHYEELVFGYQLRNSHERTVLNPRDKKKALIWENYDFAILQGSLDTIQRQAFFEVRNSGFSADTHWYDVTIDGLRTAAETFSRTLEGSTNPRATCEEALKQMSKDERIKIRSSISAMQDALALSGAANPSVGPAGNIAPGFGSSSGASQSGASSLSPFQTMGPVATSSSTPERMGGDQQPVAAVTSDGNNFEADLVPPSAPRASSGGPATHPRRSPSGHFPGGGGMRPSSPPSSRVADGTPPAEPWNCAMQCSGRGTAKQEK